MDEMAFRYRVIMNMLNRQSQKTDNRCFSSGGGGWMWC